MLTVQSVSAAALSGADTEAPSDVYPETTLVAGDSHAVFHAGQDERTWRNHRAGRMLRTVEWKPVQEGSSEHHKNQSRQFVRMAMLREWIMLCLSMFVDWISSRVRSKLEPRLSIEETGIMPAQDHLSVEESESGNKCKLTNPSASLNSDWCFACITGSVDYKKLEADVAPCHGSLKAWKACIDPQELRVLPRAQDPPARAHLLPAEERKGLEMVNPAPAQKQSPDVLPNNHQEKRRKRRRRKRKSLAKTDIEVFPKSCHGQVSEVTSRPKSMQNLFPQFGLGPKKTAILLLITMYFPGSSGQATCEQIFNSNFTIEPPIAFRKGRLVICNFVRLPSCPEKTTCERNMSLCAINSSSIQIFYPGVLKDCYIEYGQYVPEEIQFREEDCKESNSPVGEYRTNPDPVNVTNSTIALGTGQATCEQIFNSNFAIEPPIAFRKGRLVICNFVRLPSCPEKTTCERNMSLCAINSSSIQIFYPGVLKDCYIEYGQYEPEEIQFREEDCKESNSPVGEYRTNPDPVNITNSTRAPGTGNDTRNPSLIALLVILLFIIGCAVATIVYFWYRSRCQMSDKGARLSASSSLFCTPAPSIADEDISSRTISMEQKPLMSTAEDALHARSTQRSAGPEAPQSINKDF